MDRGGGLPPLALILAKSVAEVAANAVLEVLFTLRSLFFYPFHSCYITKSI